MRIVVSSDTDAGLESSVSHHFGRCPYFTIADVDGGAVSSVRVVENPFFSSHSPGQVPSFIRKLGADSMIAGGMGRRAIDMFLSYGIECSTGAFGSVRAAVEGFIAGKLSRAAPCKESVAHSAKDGRYEKEDPADRLREEARSLLERLDDAMDRLSNGGSDGKEDQT